MQISAIRTVSIPAGSRIAAASPIVQSMNQLEIGSGFDYVVAGKDKDGNPQLPHLKNQYSHVNHKRWDEQEKTFKVFKAEDQSDLGEFETRFTVARVPYTAKVAKAPKAPATQAGGNEGGEGAGNGEGSAE